jgi:hypothetical protein
MNEILPRNRRETFNKNEDNRKQKVIKKDKNEEYKKIELLI